MIQYSASPLSVIRNMIPQCRVSDVHHTSHNSFDCTPVFLFHTRIWHEVSAFGHDCKSVDSCQSDVQQFSDHIDVRIFCISRLSFALSGPMFLERYNPNCDGVDTGLAFTNPNWVRISPTYSLWSIIRMSGCRVIHMSNMHRICPRCVQSHMVMVMISFTTTLMTDVGCPVIVKSSTIYRDYLFWSTCKVPNRCVCSLGV